LLRLATLHRYQSAAAAAGEALPLAAVVAAAFCSLYLLLLLLPSCTTSLPLRCSWTEAMGRS
jgi:hypothetical protein